jgi:hypothetical protein
MSGVEGVIRWWVLEVEMLVNCQSRPPMRKATRTPREVCGPNVMARFWPVKANLRPGALGEGSQSGGCGEGVVS